MKIIFKILLGGFVLFIIINWATASLSYDADGADQYGFPLNFYTKVTGYHIETKQGSTSINFSLIALLADVVFAFAGSWLIFKLIDMFKNNN
ncbi:MULTISPECIES: hypothetical protein [Pedobacter]|uniref:hypothetical protein n=1 Tax=Pedobacter TaxID=84567 RepID=UPI001E43B073|nr:MULTISPECIES: hypothetical protein [Pedobacter]